MLRYFSLNHNFIQSWWTLFKLDTCQQGRTNQMLVCAQKVVSSLYSNNYERYRIYSHFEWFFMRDMSDSIPMTSLRHERIPFANVYHIISVCVLEWGSLSWSCGCLFPRLSAAQREIMSNNLISVAQSLFTDCMFIIACGCFVCLCPSGLV